MERERREQHPLLPDTDQLLASVEALTGKPVEVRADASIRSRGNAIYVVSDPDPSRHLVLYDPALEQYKDHLIGHECGHIKTLYEQESAERFVPALSSESRLQAIRHLGPELDRLVARGMPVDRLAERLPVWISGTVSQLVDTPADIGIEEWLREEWSGLRDVQEASLRDQVHSYAQVLSERVQEITPPSLWRASNRMNAVMVSRMADLLDDPDLFLPWERLGFGRSQIQPLLEPLSDGVETHEKARRVTMKWQEELGFEGWVRWIPLEQVRWSVTGEEQ